MYWTKQILRLEYRTFISSVLLCLSLSPCSPILSQNYFDGQPQLLIKEDFDATKLFYVDMDADGVEEVIGSTISATGYLEYSSVLSEEQSCLGYFKTQEAISHESIKILAIEDMDGDGSLDIICLEETGDFGGHTLYWLKNNGNGEFYDRSIIDDTLFFGFDELRVVDLNNDQLQDLLFLTPWGSNAIFIFLNEGNGDFVSFNVVLAPQILSLDLADRDADGDLDLLINTNSSVSWFLNDGNALFNEEVVVASNTNTFFRVQACDLNNDGLIDVLASNATIASEYVYYVQDSNGSSIEQALQFDANGSNSFFTADINQDGLEDIIASNIERIVLGINQGGEAFESITIELAAHFDRAITAADLFSGGNLELLITNSPLGFSSEDIECLIVDVDLGTMQFVKIRQRVSGIEREQWLDADGDGDNDLLFVPTIGRGLLYKEFDDGKICESQVLSSQFAFSDFEVVDVNSDGHLDVIALSYTDDLLVWFKNNSQGYFEQQAQTASIDIVSFSGELETGDIDGDGDIDFVAHDNALNRLVVFENRYPLPFAEYYIEFNGELFNPNFYLVDVDSDGLADIVNWVATEDMRFKAFFYKGTGAFSFADPTVLFEAQGAFTQLLNGDMDADGDSDFFIVYAQSVELIENRGDLGFDLDFYSFDLPPGTDHWLLHDITKDGKSDFFMSVDTSLAMSDLFVLDNLSDKVALPFKIATYSDAYLISTFFDIDDDLDKEFCLREPDGLAYIENYIEGAPIADFEFEECPFPRLINTSQTLLTVAEHNWDLGDGSTSSAIHPQASYDALGTYQISLETCLNGICSTLTKEVEVTKTVNIDIPTSGQVGETLQFSNNSLGFTNVSWILGDGTVSLENIVEHSYAETGVYQVEVFVTNSSEVECTFQVSQEIVIGDGTGISELEETAELRLQPNPCLEGTTLTFSSDDWTYGLYDMQGRLLESSRIYGGETYIDTSALEPGVYLAIVEDAAGKVFTRKLLVL